MSFFILRGRKGARGRVSFMGLFLRVPHRRDGVALTLL